MISSKGIRVVNKMTSLIGVTLTILFASVSAYAIPTFNKSFSPNTIGVGAVSTLTFSITNDASPATGAGFVDNLPAGVNIAAAPNITNNCDGSVSAAPGGTSISLSGGRIGPNLSCMITVDVTSSVVGTHTNVTGDFTSSAGNSGSATADLTVVADRPGFSKAFAPASVSLGDRSTLSFLVDNSANPNSISSVAFTDSFPTGMEIADPNNAMNTCGGNLTANPGSTSLSLTGSFGLGVIAAGASCIVSVDVVATGVGVLVNTSGSLTSLSNFGQLRDSGFAVAELAVDVSSLHLIKSFLNDPVTPGGSVDLNFSISNRDRSNPVSNIAFSDDLDAMLAGLVATGLPQSDVCGAGSSLTGTGLISLSGGQLGAGESCDFTVSLQVPAGALPGGYTNLTSAISADGVVGNMASDTLFIDVGPSIAKTFLSNPIGGGDTVTIEFTVTNNSSTDAASNVSFIDNISDFISGALPTGLPKSDVCGTGSTLNTAFITTDTFGVQLIGGSLGSGESCTFTADIVTPVGTPGSVYTNVTDAVTATIGGSVSVGNQAQASLTVVETPELDKEFIDDPAAAGGTTTLQFTIFNPESAPTAATDIAFTDNLDATLAGLVASGLPASDVCGVGSSLTGTSTISLTGGNLGIGESCVFSVSLDIPANALPGTYDNLTSDLTANLGGISAAGIGGQDSLTIAGLDVSKGFSQNPALPGSTTSLDFTLTNTSDSLAASSISFSDDLGNFLTGTTVATALPISDVCGVGSSLSLAGGDFLIFQNGSLAAGTNCTFSVDINVPAATENGQYDNITSLVQADFGGSAVVLDAATAELVVDNELIALTKSFTDDAVALGASSSIEFSVTNLSDTDTISSITFSDDLNASLVGMLANGLPQNDVCGVGSMVSGSSVVTLSGASLLPNETCSFTVGIDLPATAGGVTSITNTTSDASGSINGVVVVGAPASDSAIVVSVDFSKMFSNPNIAGDMGSLTFDIQNNGAETLDRLLFTDDLEAVLPGLSANGLPLSDVCGTGSLITGTSVITLTGGVLGAGESCQFTIDVSVPAGASSGSYVNVTSPLNDEPLDVAPPAQATLEIQVRDAILSKSFNGSANPGGSVNLKLSIQNTGTADLVDLAFSDDLDAVVSGLVASGLPLSDVCGTGSSVTGTSIIAVTGANIPAGSSCEFTVSLDIPAGTSAGDYTNVTSDLTELGDVLAPAATADLTVNAQPAVTFTKAFAGSVDPGSSTGLSFQITNTGNVALSSLSFSDNLNAVLSGLSASGLPASDVCGVGSSLSGGSVITLSGGNLAEGASCQFSVQVDVPTGTAAGTYTNVTTVLSEAGTPISTPATADLTVNQLQISAAFSKAFAASVEPGGSTTLSFEITNTGETALSQISFSDDLDSVLSGLVASGLPASDVCGTGSTVSGTSLLSLSGASLGLGESCQFSVQVDIPAGSAAGSYINTTSDLSELTGVIANPAVATLTVDEDDGLVTICHKPGTRAEKTLTLPESALGGHLGHGDYIGECGSQQSNPSGSNGSQRSTAAPQPQAAAKVVDQPAESTFFGFSNPFSGGWKLFESIRLFDDFDLFSDSDDEDEEEADEEEAEDK